MTNSSEISLFKGNIGILVEVNSENNNFSAEIFADFFEIPYICSLKIIRT